MSRILLHTFATRGYLAWVKLLLRSVEYHCGREIDVRVDALNLSEAEVSDLRNLFPGLVVNNSQLSIEEVAERLQVSRRKLERWKRQIEDGRTTNRNFWYKIFISVSRRYRSLDSVVEDAKRDRYEVLIHTDSDLYVRTNLADSALIAAIRSYDVGVYMNDASISLHHFRKVLGAFVVLNLSRSPDTFMRRWMSEIDRVPLFRRWKGFGQSALWYAVNASPDLSILDLNSIGNEFCYSRRFGDHAQLWFGSNSKLRFMRLRRLLGLNALLGRAENSRTRCWNDFRSLQQVEADKSSESALQ